MTQTRPALEGYSARHLAFVGKRRSQAGWQLGTYRGVFELLREEVGQTKIAFQLEHTVQVGTTAPVPPVATATAPPTPSPVPASAPAPTTPSPAPATSETTLPEPPAETEVAAAVTAPQSQSEAPKSFADRAEDFLPVEIPAALRGRSGSKGPPIWMVAAGLIGVILAMAGVAFLTRH